MARKYPFTYYGSKYSSLNFIIDNLPKTDKYVEPYAGSAIVLLNQEPSGHEVLNDLNGEIVNFFRALREHSDELVEKLQLTPYSREEFERAVEMRGDSSLSCVERARLFFIRCQQGRYSRSDEGRTKGEWSRSTTQIRGNRPLTVNGFFNKVDGLQEVAQRLSNTQIENKDAVSVIRDYDAEDCVMYCDPPYVPTTRGDGNAYGEYEMTLEEHEQLLSTVLDCEGFVAISGYDAPIYTDMLEDWWVLRDDERINQNGPSGLPSDNSKTQEVLWTNYNPSETPT